ncbi:MAG: hypothetical protein ABIN94_14215 [Ferruginibacter sp.]
MQIAFSRYFILFLLYTATAPVKLLAQININDSLALVDLYDSTNGTNWSSGNNWKTLAPVRTWSGVTVTNNRVTAMQMYGNNTLGIVPSSFKNLDSMLSIDFIDNGFRGNLLTYIANFKLLNHVHIGEQYLSGPFPDALGYLQTLTYIYIYGPGFNGPIPASFGNLINLRTLDVSNSDHSGDIPAAELSNLNFGPHSVILTANRYTFNELEPLVEIFTAKNKVDALEYTSQAGIATSQANGKLAVSAGGTLSHNTYHWYKQGTGLVATITGDSTYKPVLPGIYYASVTNSVATQLTLTSIPTKTAIVMVPLCPLSTSISVDSDVFGSTYLWQESVDSVNFYNITDNANFSGTQSASLQLQQVPSSWYGRRYQCIANGVSSTVFTIYFYNKWISTGTINWENAANWSCGKLPDIGTDVIINSGNVVLSSNVVVRSLSLAPGVTFTVSPGYKLTINP